MTATRAVLFDLGNTLVGYYRRGEFSPVLRNAMVGVADVVAEHTGTRPDADDLHARGMLHDLAHPDMGDVTLPASPLRLLDYDRLPVEFYPEPGAQGRDILSEWLGMSEPAIDDLAEAGVI